MSGTCPPAQACGSAPPDGTARLGLFLVDDEKRTRDGIRDGFDWAGLGIEVVGEAEDGVEALARVRRAAPDILVCDVRMPRMDGIELTRILRDRYPRLQIVFLSGYSDKEYLKSAIKVNAVDYVEKPVDDGELREAVLRAAARCRTAADAASRGRHCVFPAERRLSAFLGKDVNRTVHAVMEHVMANVGADLSLRAMADRFGLTPAYLCKLFRKETGETLHEFVTLARIEKSRQIMRDPRLKLYEVASLVGYGDQKHYARVFKRYMGCNPFEYRGSYLE